MSLIQKYLDPIRHYSLPGTRALHQELETLREAYVSVTDDLDSVRLELQRTHDEDEKLLADLRQQIRQIRTERGQAQQQVELMERSLAHAEHRQKFAESHMSSLEKKLEEERTRHDDNMQVTRTRLIHMQEEQRALLTQQAELTEHLGTIGTRLLETTGADNKPSEFTLLQIILISAVLFITGTLLGILSTQQLQDKGQALEEVSSDLRDVRGFMREHLDNQDSLIAELSLALNNLTASAQPPAEPAPLPAVPVTEPENAGFVADSQDIRNMQDSLMLLGFNLGLTEPDGNTGIKTRQAVREFANLYASQTAPMTGEVDEALLGRIIQSAEQVKADVARYAIDDRVLAAIRLGSLHSGVDFSFLMELARAESNFDATAQAPDSGAAGLYQFRPAGWIEAIRKFGSRYGLDSYTNRLDATSGDEITQQGIAHDPSLAEILALRQNPRLSTLLMAENIKNNLQSLPQNIGREPNRADLYLSHLLGPGDAVTLINARGEYPDTPAADLLPDAAAQNPLVFQKRGQQPRTIEETYRWIERKFNTGRYED